MFTGGTTVSNGTLVLSGSLASPVTVRTNAVLTGTGLITTNNATALTVDLGGIVDPGFVGGVGTLSVTGNVSFTTGSVLRVDVSGANADLLAVSGNVTGSGPVTVSVTTTNKGPWKVMTASSIAPTFIVAAPGLVAIKKNANTELWLQAQTGTSLFVK